MLGELQYPCTPILAHVLDLPWVNHWPLSPINHDFDQRQSELTVELTVKPTLQKTYCVSSA